MKKIKSLTDAEIAKFPAYVEKWTKIGLETAPANRSEAEKGVIEAYRIAGLAPPRIVWCGSAMSMALTRAVVMRIWASVGDSVRDSVGDLVRDSVRDSVGDSVWASVRDSVRASVRDSVRDSVWASVRDSVGASVRDSVWASVGDSVGASVGDSVGASVWASVRDSVWASVGDSVRDSVGASVWASVRDSVRDSVWASVWASVGDSVITSGYGQHDSEWIGYYDFFRNELGLISETDRLSGLREICINAGWYIPHDKICWISERHCVVRKDANRRLHCEDGPAVKYPDGWALYRWHGVNVPGWIIERPDEITPAKIEAEKNAEVRRVMMTKYGMARYFRETGAQPVDRDRDSKGARVLWRKDDPLGPVQIIELENSTPERDGSIKKYTFRVPPDVKTCHEAVAYLYSRDPARYRPTVES